MPRAREINPLIPGASLEAKGKKERTQTILHDTLEMAGQRSMEESTALLQERLAALRRKKINSEGCLSEADTISDIKHETKAKKISEGAITHLQIENDAVILNASDAHGSFDDLSRAITDFVQRREAGENIYFNFSGDISSGDIDEIVPCMEALASIQARYPDAVTIEIGNGDRRGTSLLMGLARESTDRFTPELHKHLEGIVQERVEQFAQEQDMDDPKKAKRTHNFLYGAELLRMARLAGTEPLNPHEFNPAFLQRLVKGATGVEQSRLVSKQVNQPLRLAIEPLRPWDKRKTKEYAPELLDQAKKVFEYWQLADRVLNEQPALAIYESEKTVALATHSGYIGAGDKLGDLAFNPRAVDRAVWSKFYHPDKGEKAGSVEKYGPGIYFSFTPEFQGQLLEKILPKDKTPILVVGHNHGNFTERVPVNGRSVLRVENCVSTSKKRAGAKAAYAEIKMDTLADNPDDPESAVTFTKIK